MTNTITLKPIKDLLKLKFYIPNYQRGYRWRKVQVEDLLKDIAQFISNSENRTSDFYCLQPLVVKETVPEPENFINALPKTNTGSALEAVREAISNNTRWEVIDGQQRLTTIFIILSYLSTQDEDGIPCFDKRHLYKLTYETRKDSTEFLMNINGTWTPSTTSVDYLFMNKAYKTVEEWFKKKDHAYKQQFTQTLLNKVQFIWYETTEKSTTVFKRLNLGKIGLTNAELIKALFLNTANFGEYEEKKIIIASQWDDFENRLQNDEFWLFIHSTEYDKPTRMEFIFNLICDMNILDEHIEWDMEKSKKDVIGTDKYRTFRYFNAFFESKLAHRKAEEKGLDMIEMCWQEVKDIFRIFEEWHNDLEMYHYVGFLINEGMSVTELLQFWSDRYDQKDKSQKKDAKPCTNKKTFREKLINEIKKIVGNCIYDHKTQSKTLEKQFETGENGPKTVCRPLLLLHNIQTVIDQNKGFKEREDYQMGVFYKFPFHLFKKESWNVEHIDSNTTNELDTDTEKMNWLKVSWYFLSDNEGLRKKIEQFINEKDAQKEFDKLHSAILEHFEAKGALSQEDKNKIKNFVLLDEHTNKSYGNAIFPMKKMVISGKDHCLEYCIVDIKDGFDIDSEPAPKYKTAFVPPVTKSAFMKEFNPLSANPYSWDSQDAEKYQKNIETTLEIFLKD